MGARQLVIVSPDFILSDEGKQGAAHAQEILKSSRRYDSLKNFLAKEGEGFRIALSGKDARLQPSEQLGDVLKLATKNFQHRIHDSRDPIYLFFGAEDDGLTAEEMEACHHVCRLPTFSEISSLNLSHAVLLTLYMVRDSLGQSTPESSLSSNEEVLTEVPETFSSALQEWLSTLGFDLSSPRINIAKTMNRLLMSKAPTKEEVRILNTVIQQTVRKLKNLDKKS